MPLTEKGSEIMNHMKSEYGPKKGESVFYASANKGVINGVHGTSDCGPMSHGEIVAKSQTLSSFDRPNIRKP